MTEQELKKMSRTDLIEMLLSLSRENEQLQEALEKAQKQLSSRAITIENAGSLAEAALSLNGVFEAAQAASEQYLWNIQQRAANQSKICAQIERETREKCDRMLENTKRQVDEYLQAVSKSIREFNDAESCRKEIPNEQTHNEM